MAYETADAIRRRLGLIADSAPPTPSDTPNQPQPDDFSPLTGIGNFFGGIKDRISSALAGSQNLAVVGPLMRGLGELYGQTVEPGIGAVEKWAGSPAANAGFNEGYKTLQGGQPDPSDIFALTRGLRAAHSASQAEAGSVAADTTRSTIERILAGAQYGASGVAENTLPVPGLGELGSLFKGRAAISAAAKAADPFASLYSGAGKAAESTGGGLSRGIEQVMSVPRTIATSAAPFHGMLRHAAAFVSYPSEWIGGWAQGARTLGQSSEEAVAHFTELRSAVDAAGGKKVYLAEPNHGVVGGEEAVGSNLVNKIPVLGYFAGKSSRAFVASLNEVRAAAFSHTVDFYDKAGTPLSQLQKDSLADTINHFSGRGFDVRYSQQALVRGLNSTFFAPQLTTSRVRMFGDAINGMTTLTKNILTGQPLDPIALVQVRLTGGYLAALGSIYYMANQMGIKVDTNPVSTFFGKMGLGATSPDSNTLAEFGDQIGWTAQTINGETWIDPTANEGPLFRTAARLITGHEVSAGGKDIQLNAMGPNGKPVFGSPTYFDILKDFAESKLSPVPYQIVQALENRPTDIASLFLPIAIHSYLQGLPPTPTPVTPGEGAPPFQFTHGPRPGSNAPFQFTHGTSQPAPFQFTHGSSTSNDPGQYQDVARAAALQAGLDPNIFMRMINQESGFNPAARSPAGAIGIAQIMPATARGWGVDPTDPVASLFVAAKNVARYLATYGRYDLALAAYNAGPGAVDQYGGVPPYPETQRYIRNILGG